MTVTLKFFLILLVSSVTYCKPPDPIKFRNRRVKTTTVAPSSSPSSSNDEYENVTTDPTIKEVGDLTPKSSYQQKGSIVVGSRWESEKTSNPRKRVKARLHPTKPPIVENYQPIPQNPVWTNDDQYPEHPDLSGWNEQPEQPVKYKVVETDEYPSVDDIPWTPMIKMPTGEIVEDRIPEENLRIENNMDQFQIFSPPTQYKPEIQQKPVIVQAPNLPKSEFQAWIKPLEPTKFYSKPIVVPEILPKPEPQKWPVVVEQNIQKPPNYEYFDQKWVMEQKIPSYYVKPPRVIREEMPRWENLRQVEWNNGQRPHQPTYNPNFATSYSNSMMYYEPQQKQPRSSHIQATSASSNTYEVVPHAPMRPPVRPKYKEIIHPTIYQIIRYPATLEDVQAHLSELPAMAPPLDQFLNQHTHHNYKPKFRPSTHLPEYMIPQFGHVHHKENVKPVRMPSLQEIRFQQQNYAKKYLRDHPPKIQLKSKKNNPSTYGSHDQVQQAASSQHPTSQKVESETSKEFNSKSDIEKPENNNDKETTVSETEDDEENKDYGDLEKKT